MKYKAVFRHGARNYLQIRSEGGGGYKGESVGEKEGCLTFLAFSLIPLYKIIVHFQL